MKTPLRLGALLALIAAGLAQAQTQNPHLQKAESQIDALDYEKAAKSLQLAWKTPGNDYETVLRILEKQGFVAANLNDADGAIAFFRIYLSIAPTRPLRKEYAPKVMTRFYEAKAWVEKKGPLKFEALPEVMEGELVTELLAAVKSDPLKLAREVTFHVRDGSGVVKTTKVKLTGDTVKLKVSAPKLEWWAVLYGEGQAMLGFIGAADAPVLAPPPPAPVIEAPKPQIVIVERPVEPSKPVNLRNIAYPMLGAAVVSAGAGLFFGLQSNSARAQFSDATRDPSGTVTGVTQQRAVELQQQATTGATVANILFAASVGLAAGGAALYFLGGEAAVAPAPSGVVVSGRLP